MAAVEMFPFNEDDQNKILSEFGRNLETVKEDVKIIREWLNTQEHLPDVITDNRIEKLLLCSKFSLERVKQKIENYYIVKKLIPDLFKKPLNEETLATFEDAYSVALPKYTPNSERIVISGFLRPPNVEKFKFEVALSHVFNLCDVMLEHDYFSKIILLYSMEHVSYDLMLKINPLDIKKFISVLEKAYTMRFSKVYLFNGAPFTMKLFEIVKLLFPKKLKDRVHFIEGTKFFLEEFPKEIVPKDFGGLEKSLEELKEISFKTLAENKEMLIKLRESTLDESKKPLDLKNDEFLGYYGSFRKADFD